MKGRYEDCGGTTSSKYISPSPFVQSVVDIVNVTVFHQEPTKLVHKQPKKPSSDFIQVREWKFRKDLYLAQAISWMTDPNRRKVQLKASPTAFQYGPSRPSSTSNHCSPKQCAFNCILYIVYETMTKTLFLATVLTTVHQSQRLYFYLFFGASWGFAMKIRNKWCWWVLC